MGCLGSNKKNYLQNPSENSETNLLSLTNPSLANIYSSTILLNNGAIRLKDSSRKLVIICTISFFSIFNTLYVCSNVRYDRV